MKYTFKVEFKVDAELDRYELFRLDAAFERAVLHVLEHPEDYVTRDRYIEDLDAYREAAEIVDSEVIG